VRHFVSSPHGWHENNFHNVTKVCEAIPEDVRTTSKLDR
jgi:hypothetical protein